MPRKPTPEQGEQQLREQLAAAERSTEDLRLKLAQAREQEAALENARRPLLIDQALDRDNASAKLTDNDRQLNDARNTIAGLSELRRTAVDQVAAIERELRTYHRQHWQHFAANHEQACDEWEAIADQLEPQLRAWADAWNTAARRHGELRVADITAVKPFRGGENPVTAILAALAQAREQGAPRLEAAYVDEGYEPKWPQPEAPPTLIEPLV